MDILGSSCINLGQRKLIGLVVALLMSLALTATIAPQSVQAAEAQSGYDSGHYHWVVAGDTLAKLAHHHGITAHQLAHANGISVYNYIYTGQKLYIPASSGSAHGCAQHYTVKYGDTLANIAWHYGVNVKKLAHQNHIYSPWIIHVGQTICIPHGHGSSHTSPPHSGHSHHGYHVVVYGDTLADIAWYYGTTAYELAAINHISDVDHIYVGQHLKLSY